MRRIGKPLGCGLIVLLLASLAFAQAPKAPAPPHLRVTVNAAGIAELRPVFPGRAEGGSKYRWDRANTSGNVTTARLLWIDNDSWPAVSEYALPLEWADAVPGPIPEPQPTPAPKPPIPPVPVPEPTPTPTPNPVPADLWGAVIIEETKTRTPVQAAVITSAEVEAYCGSHKLLFRVADQDEVDAEGKTPKGLGNYIARAKKAGLPHVFLVGVKGGVLWEGELPDTPQGLIDLLTKHALKGTKP